MESKNKNNILLVWTILSLMLINGACSRYSQDEIPEHWMPLINKNIEYHRKKKEKECRQKAIDEAEIIVDSLLKERAIKLEHDSIDIPEKPLKPEKPERKIPRDSTPVNPLINIEDEPVQ